MYDLASERQIDVFMESALFVQQGAVDTVPSLPRYQCALWAELLALLMS